MMQEKIERIKLENVSKSFDLNFKKSGGALSRLVSIIKKEKKNKLKAINNISLKADSGEVVGLIGPNGSGKSTLLRVIAGIYTKDSGLIKTSGKMLYLSGFGKALYPKLTMRENIFLIGAIMGLNQKTIKNRFDDIVELSGLKEFLDMRICQFSSGMVSRLSFSIGIHCLKHHEPEILLLDEVFGSGGDIDFQMKATKKMTEFIKNGATVILVSHKLGIIKKHCDRAMLLVQGEILKSGDPKEIVEFYENNFSKKQNKK